MIQSQCTHCGHVVTGFEQQQFEADQALLQQLQRELAAARAQGVLLREALEPFANFADVEARAIAEDSPIMLELKDCGGIFGNAKRALSAPSQAASAMVECVEALRFYAAVESYKYQAMKTFPPVMSDCGERARNALSRYDEACGRTTGAKDG